MAVTLDNVMEERDALDVVIETDRRRNNPRWNG
jgi:hypothetical protein